MEPPSLLAPAIMRAVDLRGRQAAAAVAGRKGARRRPATAVRGRLGGAVNGPTAAPTKAGAATSAGAMLLAE